MIRKRKVVTNFHEMFKPDQILGDHYYRCSDYDFIFGTLGYNLKYRRLKAEQVIYVADKKAGSEFARS